MAITAATDDGGGIGAPTLKYFSIMQVSIHRPISITFNRNRTDSGDFIGDFR